MRRALRRAVLGGALLAGAALPAAAEPLDLSDPTPRAVAVRFEVSPRERPGDRDRHYTPRLRAWLEPAGPGSVRLLVPSAAVERHLLADHAPLPGSFSDFVWLFETATGHVLSAELRGVLLRQVALGPLGMRIEAQIEARMDTRAEAGFRAPVTLFGQRIFAACGPGESGCELVAAQRLDPASGYVNAVGRIAARSALLATESFSPLGEAIFEEWQGERAARVSQ